MKYEGIYTIYIYVNFYLKQVPKDAEQLEQLEHIFGKHMEPPSK